MSYVDRINSAKTLEDLQALLNNANADERAEIAANPNLMSSLPVFGGIAPSNTMGVWSWDEKHLLVGDSVPFEIVNRW